MATTIHTSEHCRMIRYWGGRRQKICLDIIPSPHGTKIKIKSIEEAEKIIAALKDFIDYKKEKGYKA